jgi:carbamoyl-phosphate synthase large subunit
MEIVYDETMLHDYLTRAAQVNPEHPVLVDRFLDDAIEIDVDALYDGTDLYLGGVMEHIEEAGIHSGDSACSLPPYTLGAAEIERIRTSTLGIAKGVGVRGLLNVQYALANGILYVLEANPRASRTVPFVSKATGNPLAKCAALIATGKRISELRELGLLPTSGDGVPKGISVKEAVLPWNRFRRDDGSGVDSVLGPEMRSTGEVMGIAKTFGEAYAKSQTAAFGALPLSGSVFLSLSERDKKSALEPARTLSELGFKLFTTQGTYQYLLENGVGSEVVRKHSQGRGANGEFTAVDLITEGVVGLVINTPLGRGTRFDGWMIRTAAIQRGVPCITTIAGFKAAVAGISELQGKSFGINSIQEWLAISE